MVAEHLTVMMDFVRVGFMNAFRTFVLRMLSHCLLLQNEDMITKIWDANGNLLGVNNSVIPSGGAQFTFHLDRLPQKELCSADKNESAGNRLNLQELWEEIQLSRGRQRALPFEHRNSSCFDKLPPLLNDIVASRGTEAAASSAHHSSIRGISLLHTDSCKYVQSPKQFVEFHNSICDSPVRCGNTKEAHKDDFVGSCGTEAAASPTRHSIIRGVSLLHTDSCKSIQPSKQFVECQNSPCKSSVRRGKTTEAQHKANIWIPIENFPEWHKQKLQLWREERAVRRYRAVAFDRFDDRAISKKEKYSAHYSAQDVAQRQLEMKSKCFQFSNGKGKYEPSLSEIASQQSIEEKIKYIQDWRNSTSEEQEPLRKKRQEVRFVKGNPKKKKREVQKAAKNKENIAVPPDAFEEIETFCYSIMLVEYYRGCIQITDNASKQLEVFVIQCLRNIFEESRGPASKARRHTMHVNRKLLPPSHQHVADEQTQLRSNKCRNVLMSEQPPRIVAPARPGVARFSTNFEEGMQSLSSPLDAVYCVGTRGNFRQVKVTVKWGILERCPKKRKCRDNEQPRLVHNSMGNYPTSTTFDVHEIIFAWDRNHLYKAKILKMKEEAKCGAMYLVHYAGYPKSQDKWVTPNDMLKDNPLARRFYKENLG